MIHFLQLPELNIPFASVETRSWYISMSIFARLSALSGIAEHMMELKDPDKSPTGNCSKRVSALAVLVCQFSCNIPWEMVRKGKCSNTSVTLQLSVAVHCHFSEKTHYAELKEQEKSTFHLFQYRFSLFQTPFWSELATQVHYIDLAIFNICSKTWVRNYRCSRVNGKVSSYVSEIKSI